MKRILAIGAAALACFAATAVVASAIVRHGGRRTDNLSARVLYDCASSRSGLLQHRYSERVLRIAQRHIRGDVAEYTGCTQAVRSAIRQSTGTIVASVHRSRRGGAAAARITLLGQDGRSADVINVRRGESAHFRVIPGRYRVRADGRRGCTANVRATKWRTAGVRVVCPRR